MDTDLSTVTAQAGGFVSFDGNELGRAPTSPNRANRNTIIHIGEQSLRHIDAVRRRAWAQANPDPSPRFALTSEPRLLEPWTGSDGRCGAGSRGPEDSGASLRDAERGGRCAFNYRVDPLPVAVRAAGNRPAHCWSSCKCHTEVENATTVVVSVA